jgi:hypothetical protein
VRGVRGRQVTRRRDALYSSQHCVALDPSTTKQPSIDARARSPHPPSAHRASMAPRARRASSPRLRSMPSDRCVPARAESRMGKEHGHLCSITRMDEMQRRGKARDSQQARQHGFLLCRRPPPSAHQQRIPRHRAKRRCAYTRTCSRTLMTCKNTGGIAARVIQREVRVGSWSGGHLERRASRSPRARAQYQARIHHCQTTL